MKWFYFSAVGCWLLLAAAMAHTEKEPAEVLKTDPHLTQEENAYLDRQAEAFLDTVEGVLEKEPPQAPLPEVRRMGLLLLDAVLHDKYAAARKPVQAFFHHRIERALEEIERTKVAEGAMIWRLYNMSFIVRTPSVTMAFDLVNGASSGFEAFAVPDDVMTRLAAQCDALFISHFHGDHKEELVARCFLDAGKPVVGPPSLWAKEPVGERVTRLERNAEIVQSLPIQSGKASLKVVVYPGHQNRPVENNVTLVISPEGLSFCHNGDQFNDGAFMEDFAWIDDIAKHHLVDVAMPACWTANFERIAAGMRPALVMPGHENEMGHPLDHREPYWGDSNYLSVEHTKEADMPPIVLTAWGESYHYVREK